jgi:hypothetical protein
MFAVEKMDNVCSPGKTRAKREKLCVEVAELVPRHSAAPDERSE